MHEIFLKKSTGTLHNIGKCATSIFKIQWWKWWWVKNQTKTQCNIDISSCALLPCEIEYQAEHVGLEQNSVYSYLNNTSTF